MERFRGHLSILLIRLARKATLWSDTYDWLDVALAAEKRKKAYWESQKQHYKETDIG